MRTKILHWRKIQSTCRQHLFYSSGSPCGVPGAAASSLQAAPNRYESGLVIGSCSLSGIDSEILGRRLAELSKRVMYCAQEISRHMG